MLFLALTAGKELNQILNSLKGLQNVTRKAQLVTFVKLITLRTNQAVNMPLFVLHQMKCFIFFSSAVNKEGWFRPFAQFRCHSWSQNVLWLQKTHGGYVVWRFYTLDPTNLNRFVWKLIWSDPHSGPIVPAFTSCRFRVPNCKLHCYTVISAYLDYTPQH